MKYPTLVLLLCPVIFFGKSCSSDSAADQDPLGRAFGPAGKLLPEVSRIDWGSDELMSAGGVTIGRQEFNQYLCTRYAAGWIETRAVIRLLQAGFFSSNARPVSVPEEQVLVARKWLAGAVADGDEGKLRQALLAQGWGEVRLLDVLRARLLATELMGKGAPPVIPPKLADLRSDGLAVFVGELVTKAVARGCRFALDRRQKAGTDLYWHREKVLVDTGEALLVDLLGVITPSERGRALVEFWQLRLLEKSLGKVAPAKQGTIAGDTDEAPAQAWLARLTAAFNQSQQREGPPFLRDAGIRLQNFRLRGSFLLVPALRNASGRSGTWVDLGRAQKRAKALLTRLEAGAKMEVIADEIMNDLSPLVGKRVKAVHKLGENYRSARELSAVLTGGSLGGLGLGCEPGRALILLAKPGKWQCIPSWWGPVLVKVESFKQESGKAGYDPQQLHFYHWLRSLLTK